MNEIQSAPETTHVQGKGAGYLALMTGVLGTSTGSLLYKLSFITGLSPLWINVLRLGITLLLMAPMTFFSRNRRNRLLHVTKSGFWISTLSGTFLALHFTAWALALQNTDVFAASAIWGTYLLMTALFSSLFLNEKTSRGALVGMLIATAGVVICNLDGGIGKLTGNLLALLAALLQALYTLCGRKAREQMDTNTYTSILYAFTFVWMVLFVWIFGIKPTGFQPQNLLWALGLAVFATLLGHSMLSRSLKYLKASTASAVMLVTVVTAPLAVYLVTGDVPSVYTFIGGCVIILGLLWYLRMEKRDAQAARKAEEVAASETVAG
ncbi:MAG: DMT family transporter [Eubacteriales bacterium]|nr:DMT family transporter [Eubacteriales bacterium]